MGSDVIQRTDNVSDAVEVYDNEMTTTTKNVEKKKKNERDRFSRSFGDSGNEGRNYVRI